MEMHSSLYIHVKEVYSNICMKIHRSSELIVSIFKMIFLMRNCLKYAQQCQNGIFKKHVG